MWFHIPFSTLSGADKVSTQLNVKNNPSALPMVNVQRTHIDTVDFELFILGVFHPIAICKWGHAMQRD